MKSDAMITKLIRYNSIGRAPPSSHQ